MCELLSHRVLLAVTCLKEKRSAKFYNSAEGDLESPGAWLGGGEIVRNERAVISPPEDRNQAASSAREGLGELVTVFAIMH